MASSLRLDHVPDIDPHLVRHKSQFVDQSNVDRPKRILHEFSHLRFFGFHRDHLFEDLSVKVNGSLRALLCNPADDLWDIPYAILSIPRIDSAF